MSSGGLVAALSGVDRSQHEFVWLGWVGCEIPAEEQLDFQTQLWEKHKCIPGTYFGNIKNAVLHVLCFP
jgi:trehalose-6-phosphate synthase